MYGQERTYEIVSTHPLKINEDVNQSQIRKIDH